MNDTPLYVIERTGTGKPKYRYRSLYNGSTGTWTTVRDEAIRQGDVHERLIRIKLDLPVD